MKVCAAQSDKEWAISDKEFLPSQHQLATLRIDTTSKDVVVREEKKDNRRGPCKGRHQEDEKPKVGAGEGEIKLSRARS